MSRHDKIKDLYREKQTFGARTLVAAIACLAMAALLLFLAAELGLKSVRLVKDVDGLYDHDPNDHTAPALRYRRASWETARQVGGALVQHDAIDLGESRGVEIEVAALDRADGTVIGERSAPPGPAPALQPLKVAVAGCGVVGGGVLNRLLGDPRYQVVGVLHDLGLR